ncbi:glyoxylase-like metal-dependent hydrolase (beta-lactamase superfamily II) [Orenia metallireducens]|uniref:Glyoxylase, beta-lactamase superfamily II n=1 Tax=Orenia metallireducens TaxID=1413210 RepID=A0A285HW65_9FIRM|nr:MBL fold metallo-hydrolase [Orenia metallireducens]PRX29332.1 glyoxylase-like metal-dependent hydrolase (beta-lactamase superfamily II) [Orenia metallireducens]SNY39934.1 Glyoxylase, beta-lactamase superfamily II [Orenia metallireducens]
MNNPIIRVKMGKSNSYLIQGEEGLILVDAGIPNKVTNLVKVLKKINKDILDINLIIATHVHYDHVGSLSKIKDKSGALVLVHSKEKDLLAAGSSGFPKGTIFFSKIISRLANKFLKESFEAVTPDIIVEKEFDLSEFGVKGKVIHTPGHTIGSISVIINEKHCICGDTLFNFLPQSIYPPFANNEELLIESWKKISNYRCERYYPGHGGEFDQIKFEKGLHRAIN